MGPVARVLFEARSVQSLNPVAHENFISHRHHPRRIPHKINNSPKSTPKAHSGACNTVAVMKEPRTELQIAASRANGARSRGPVTAKGKRAAAANADHATGPVTPEGKAHSAQNAIRHGLLADTLVFPGESEERFCDLLATLEQELQPAPGIETDQVHVIAAAHWRRMRLWSVEKSQYLEETAKRLEAAGHRQEQDTGEPPLTHLTRSFRTLSDVSRALELLNRYESRYSREYRNALACFKNHRADKEREMKRERAQRMRKVG
jgi:hypothetical protein